MAWSKSGTLAVTGGSSSPTGLPSYAPSGLTHVWDPSRSVYNWQPATLHTIRAKLKKYAAGVAPFHMVIMGDSTMIGYDGGTPIAPVLANSIPYQIGKTISSLLGTQPFTMGVQLAIAASGYAGDRWVLTGTFASAVATYPNFLTATAGTGTATWTSIDPGTSLDLYYSNLSSAFTYQIDGGSAVNVTPTGASTVAKVTVSGLANTTHSIKVNAATGGYTFIMGTRIYNPSLNQFHVHNLSVGGAHAASYTSGYNAGLDWTNTTSTGLGYSSPSTLSAAGITPDMLLICIGNNDASTGTAGGTSVANITAGINTMMGYYSGVPVVLMHPPKVSGTDDTFFNSFSGALFTLADSHPAAYFDWNDWDGTLTGYNADGLAGTDGIHPIAAEQAALGRHLAGMLIGAEETNLPRPQTLLGAPITTGYPPRNPVSVTPAGWAHYKGNVTPTDWVPGDSWDNTP